jgi:DNA-binding NarL/FixJ family response regulator
VVVLTSSNNDVDMREAYELGANGFIVKPRTQEAFQEMAGAFARYWLQWNRADAHASADAW